MAGRTRRRILMVVPFFPPVSGGGVYRPLAFVRYLPRYGWNPTVITPRPRSFWIEDQTLAEAVPEDCQVLRTPVLSGQKLLALLRRGRTQPVRSSRGFSFLRRLSSAVLLPDSYVGWYPFAVRAASRLLAEGPFDALYSTSPPETSHLVAYRLHRRFGLPWVADFRDPWMNLHLYRPPSPLHRLLHRRLEGLVYRHAFVVVTTRWHYQRALEEGVERSRLRLIPNGYDGAEIAALEPSAPSEDRFRILHAGMLTQRRSAVPFLRGLRVFLDRNPDAEVEVWMLGAREDRNERAVGELGLGGVVRFVGNLPHRQALQEEKRSHILLLIKHDDPVYRGLVPGKLYEYIGVGRPILGVVPEGEAAELIRNERRGEVAPPDRPEEIAAKIELLYRKYQEGTLDRDYRLGAREQFDRRRQCALLAEFLEELLAGRRVS